MAKIELDKYYTPKKLAEYCVNKTKEIIGEENITEWLEPSAGCGNFLDYLGDSYLAYDIAPEDDRIAKQDYLGLDLEYKKGRCIIGNPPFGKRNTLAVKFYKKSINLEDYIAFILPISQLNNNNQMYEFDLVYSEDLGLYSYSGVDLNCCFNIYKRSKNLNKKPNYKLKSVKIKEFRRGNKNNIIPSDYNIGICSFGSGIVGKIPEYQGQYVKEFYFKIDDLYYDNIKNLIINTDWEKDVCNAITGQCNLAQWQVYKYIKEQIPEIE